MKYNILYFGLVGALLLYLIFGSRGLVEYNNLLEIRHKYQTKVNKLDKKIESLENELELLKKDKVFLEMIIRENLNMKKPEEELYIFENKKDDEKVYSKRDNKSN